MIEIKPHEFTLLDEIAQDSMVTQANLPDLLGIAVGSVHWYIKRLVIRGRVNVSHLDRTRLKYDLTAEGMAVLSKLPLHYSRDSLRVCGEYRIQAKALINDLKKHGIRSVYIDGNDEIMDIMRLTCIENEILLSDAPQGVALKTVGQEFQAFLNLVKRNHT